jgi:ABC-type sugar transport systems, permease components
MRGSKGRIKYFLILPSLLPLLFLTLYPTIFAYYLSIHKITIRTFHNPEFTGVTNFINVAVNYQFWYSVGFTALYSAIVTPIEIALGLLLAILLNREIYGRRIIITLMLTPLAIAPSLMAIMMKLMFNEFVGLVPYILRYIGVNHNFFRDFNSSFITLIITDILQWTPFVFIIAYSGLQALPREPYEAALIDGADSKRIFRHITLPLLKPLLLLVSVLRFMDAYKLFEYVHIMTGGGPGFSTTTSTLFTYRVGFIHGDFGLAAATTLFLFYITMVSATIGLRILNKVRII